MSTNKPKQPAEEPKPDPKRKPYPVEELPVPPGSDPDYFPGKPLGGDTPTM